MRSVIVVALLLGTGGGHALGEVLSSPPTPRPSSAAVKVEHEAAIANCTRLWDRGTHMTEQQWLIACRRVQNQLLNLQVR